MFIILIKNHTVLIEIISSIKIYIKKSTKKVQKH